MNIFKKFGKWVKKVIGLGSLFVRNRSFIAVQVTENLKKFFDGPYDNILAAAIPGSWAPELVRYLEVQVPKLAVKVAIAHKIIHSEGVESELIELLRAEFKKLSEVDQNSYLAEFAGRLNTYLADGEISEAEGWNEAKEFYDFLFKKK